MNECLNGLLIKTENTLKEKMDYKNSLIEQINECEKFINNLIQKKTDIEEKTKQNDELKEKKNNLSNELLKKQSLLETKKLEKNSLELTFNEKRQNYENQIESEKRILKSIDSEKESKIKSIDEKTEIYSAQIKILESEIKDLKNQSLNKNKDIENILIKINSFSINSIDEDEINILSSEIKSYESIISENKIISEYNKKLESDKKNDKIELEKFKDKRKKFENEKFNLESAKVVMNKDYPSWVIEGSIENIESDINEFIDTVYYKPLNVHFDSKSSKSGIKMTFGKDIPIKRCSGCESAITKIGFINSFNKNLGLSTIILDEPDAPMSDSIKSEFYTSLLDMKSIFNQMIIVSHSEKMCNFLQANTECNLITL